jgi:hypothetical protein
MRLINIIFILLVLSTSSCSEPNARQVMTEKNTPQSINLPNQSDYRVYEWNHKGHTYLIIDRSHGSGITHAGHCECNNK